MRVVRFIWLLLPLTLVGIDFSTKTAIALIIPLQEVKPVIPGFFNLTMSYNYGAIFGTISGAPAFLRAIIFGLASVIILAYFGWEFLRVELSTMHRIALGFVLGGAIGNSIDRLLYGFVIDFLDFVFFGWHYWTFNLADSFILIGIVLLLVVSVTAKRPLTD